MARTKRAASSAPIPQDRDGAAAALREIGDVQRAIARLEADLNDQVARLKEAAEATATPLRARIEALTEGLSIWAAAHREVLTGGRSKTVDLGTGEIAWRDRPPSVRVSDAETVMAILEERGLERFVRVRKEVDRQAILAEPEAVADVPGLRVGSAGEEFVARPFAVELAGGQP